jgi:hypothetical protein
MTNWTAAFLSPKQSWFGTKITEPNLVDGAGIASGGSFLLWTLFNSLTSPAEVFKIFLFGGFLETLRRLVWRIWGYILSYCYLEATLERNEPAYRRLPPDFNQGWRFHCHRMDAIVAFATSIME